MTTYDCAGLPAEHETQISLDDGWVQLVALDTGSKTGDLTGQPLNLGLSGIVALSSPGLELSGAFALGTIVTGEDAEEVACWGEPGDFDGDGFLSDDFGGDDCNDSAADTFPGAAEICDNRDEDCDGVRDEDFEGDGDGHLPIGALCPHGDDCDDSDDSVYTGVPEVEGDGVDQDCDGVDPTPWHQISGGYDITCGLNWTDEIVCLGREESLIMTAPPPAGPWDKVRPGWSHACALNETTGEIACWGSDAVDAAVPPSGTFKALDTEDDHSCGITTDDQLLCWGSDSSNPEGPQDGYVDVALADNSTCAIRADDASVDCWGSSQNDQDEGSPWEYVQIAGGRQFYCAIRTQGWIECWG